MDVRRLGPEDAGEILRASDLFDEAPDPMAVQSYLGDDRNVVLLAYDGRQIVGFLRGTELRQLKSERRQMFLYEIEVAEGYRRQGIGRQLVQRLLRHCTDRGFEEVFVFTDDPANKAAERLYRSTGGMTETMGDRMYVYKLKRYGGCIRFFEPWHARDPQRPGPESSDRTALGAAAHDRHG
jgi:ribosomal protein S18 acetylase RimI-like enzyme